MFRPVHHTRYPPPGGQPLMIWDGQCGFCAFWVRRWQMITGPAVVYEPFQTAAAHFPDIPAERFREAARLIEPDGSVYSGPGAAYRSFTYGSRWQWTWRWYSRMDWFRRLSDYAYDWVSGHRSFLLRVTHLLFGRDPERLQPYWVYYLVLLVLLIWLAG